MDDVRDTMPTSAEAHRSSTGIFYPVLIKILCKIRQTPCSSRQRERKGLAREELTSWFSCVSLAALYCLCVLLLQISMSVELNPGPQSEQQYSSQMQQWCCAMEERYEQIMNGIHALSQNVNRKMDQNFELLETTLGQIVEDIDKLQQSVQENREDIQELREDRDNVLWRLDNLEKELETLEMTSRRSNLKFLGVAEHRTENYRTSLERIVDLLNDFSSSRSWRDDDIESATRVGSSRQRNSHQPRPLIVRFHRWSDKMAILNDSHLRDSLRREGIKISADLTSRQRDEVQHHRSQGKIAYFKSGRLRVEERINPHSRNFRQFDGNHRNRQYPDDRGDRRNESDWVQDTQRSTRNWRQAPSHEERRATTGTRDDSRRDKSRSDAQSGSRNRTSDEGNYHEDASAWEGNSDNDDREESDQRYRSHERYWDNNKRNNGNSREDSRNDRSHPIRHLQRQKKSAAQFDHRNIDPQQSRHDDQDSAALRQSEQSWNREDRQRHDYRDDHEQTYPKKVYSRNVQSDNNDGTAQQHRHRPRREDFRREHQHHTGKSQQTKSTSAPTPLVVVPGNLSYSEAVRSFPPPHPFMPPFIPPSIPTPFPPFMPPPIPSFIPPPNPHMVYNGQHMGGYSYMTNSNNPLTDQGSIGSDNLRSQNERAHRGNTTDQPATATPPSDLRDDNDRTVSHDREPSPHNDVLSSDCMQDSTARTDENIENISDAVNLESDRHSTVHDADPVTYSDDGSQINDTNSDSQPTPVTDDIIPTHPERQVNVEETEGTENNNNGEQLAGGVAAGDSPAKDRRPRSDSVNSENHVQNEQVRARSRAVTRSQSASVEKRSQSRQSNTLSAWLETSSTTKQGSTPTSSTSPEDNGHD